MFFLSTNNQHQSVETGKHNIPLRPGRYLTGLYLPWLSNDVLELRELLQLCIGQMPFLSPNQQCTSTEGINTHT